jgi:NhaA family Na+:H+ antiporter
LRIISRFVKLESFSGILLFIAAVLGLIIANSPAQFIYTKLLYQYHIYDLINNSLMVLFFLTVGLEIKREILIGELSSKKKIILPIIAAIFGMLIPAIIYIGFNISDKNLLRGWAIPAATDIAFALGALSLLGRRIPLSIKIFLTALAIFDDFGAIIIIAIFYTQTLHWIYIGLTGLILIALYFLNYCEIKKLIFYIILGILLWFSVLQSGIHPTIAGVLFAFALPKEKLTLENKLHPWMAYLILPLFAFSNMGIPLHNFNFHLLLSPLSLGIILGLFLGKQLGIFLSVWLSVRFNISHLPSHGNFKQMYGVALLCGIGFTMSLFIGSLAFQDVSLINTVRAGVLVGSVISGVFGYLFLRYL